jgi:type IV secretion system protein VirB11
MNAPERARDLARPVFGVLGAADPRVELQATLAPLATWLEREDVDALFVNRPGVVWIDCAGSGSLARIEAPPIDDALLMRIASHLGRISPQALSRHFPLRTANLPDGTRIQVVGPSVTREHWALAICRPRIDDLGLLAYTRRPGARSRRAFDAIELDVDDPIDALQRAVAGHATILISGGASSGKTLFLGGLLRNVPDNERVIVVEDSPELRFHADNAVGLSAVKGVLGETRLTASDLLQVALRLRPDRLVLGELREGDALPFLRAVTGGHPGSFTTIQADSPRAALEQVALLLMQGGLGLSHDDSIRYAASAIDLVVQLDRRGGYRRVAQIATAQDLVG